MAADVDVCLHLSPSSFFNFRTKVFPSGSAHEHRADCIETALGPLMTDRPDKTSRLTDIEENVLKAILSKSILIVGPFTPCPVGEETHDWKHSMSVYALCVSDGERLTFDELRNRFQNMEYLSAEEKQLEMSCCPIDCVNERFLTATQVSDGCGDVEQRYGSGAIFTADDPRAERSYSSGSNSSLYPTINHSLQRSKFASPEASREGSTGGSMVVATSSHSSNNNDQNKGVFRDPAIGPANIKPPTCLLSSPQLTKQPLRPQNALVGLEATLLQPLTETPSDHHSQLLANLMCPLVSKHTLPGDLDTPTGVEHGVIAVASSPRAETAENRPEESVTGRRESEDKEDRRGQVEQESGSSGSSEKPLTGTLHEFDDLHELHEKPKSLEQMCGSSNSLAKGIVVVVGDNVGVHREPNSLGVNEPETPRTAKLARAVSAPEGFPAPTGKASYASESRIGKAAIKPSSDIEPLTKPIDKEECIGGVGTTEKVSNTEATRNELDNLQLKATSPVSKSNTPVNISTSEGFPMPQTPSIGEKAGDPVHNTPDLTVPTSSMCHTSSFQPQLPSPSSPATTPNPMVQAYQRQTSADGETVMTGEMKYLGGGIHTRVSEVSRQTSVGESVISESCTSSVVNEMSLDGISEEELDAHALEHVCNGRQAECIFRGQRKLCRQARKDKERFTRVKGLERQYRKESIINEAFKNAILTHCARSCTNKECDIPHRAAGCMPPHTPTSSMGLATGINISYDSQPINDSRNPSHPPVSLHMPSGGQCTEDRPPNHTDLNLPPACHQAQATNQFDSPDGRRHFGHQTCITSPDFLPGGDRLQNTARFSCHPQVVASPDVKRTPMFDDYRPPSPYDVDHTGKYTLNQARPSNIFDAQHGSTKRRLNYPATIRPPNVSSPLNIHPPRAVHQECASVSPQDRNYCYQRPPAEDRHLLNRALQLHRGNAVPDADQGFLNYHEYTSRSCAPGTVLYSSLDVKQFLIPGSTVYVDFDVVPTWDILGRGGNGLTFRYQLMGWKFAVKHTRHRKEELNIWSKFNHPNIIPLKAVVLGPLAGTGNHGYCYQFMDRMDETLSDAIRRLGYQGLMTLYGEVDLFEWEDVVMPNVQHILTAVLSGLGYIHEENLVHNDIKGSNILIRKHPNCFCLNIFRCECPPAHKCLVQIADFDSIRLSPRSTNYTHLPGLPCVAKSPEACRKVMGTPGYRPPEQFVMVAPVVNQGDVGVSYVGQWCDVWSFGVLVMQMFLGTDTSQEKRDACALVYQPHRKLSGTSVEAEGVFAIVRLNKLLLSMECPTVQQAGQFVGQCLKVDFRNRPTTQHLLDHAFLKKSHS